MMDAMFIGWIAGAFDLEADSISAFAKCFHLGSFDERGNKVRQGRVTTWYPTPSFSSDAPPMPGAAGAYSCRGSEQIRAQRR